MRRVESSSFFSKGVRASVSPSTMLSGTCAVGGGGGGCGVGVGGLLEEVRESAIFNSSFISLHTEV